MPAPNCRLWPAPNPGPRVMFEIDAARTPDEAATEAGLIDLAYELAGCRLVATHDARS